MLRTPQVRPKQAVCALSSACPRPVSSLASHPLTSVLRPRRALSAPLALPCSPFSFRSLARQANTAGRPHVDPLSLPPFPPICLSVCPPPEGRRRGGRDEEKTERKRGEMRGVEGRGGSERRGRGRSGVKDQLGVAGRKQKR
eukprot:1507158-Rhodomonas_salina.1